MTRQELRIEQHKPIEVGGVKITLLSTGSHVKGSKRTGQERRSTARVVVETSDDDANFDAS